MPELMASLPVAAVDGTTAFRETFVLLDGEVAPPGVVERLARDALAACSWNQKDAAARLSLTYDQMRGLVRKHRLKEPDASD